jgi:hypothetical protein
LTRRDGRNLLRYAIPDPSEFTKCLKPGTTHSEGDDQEPAARPQTANSARARNFPMRHFRSILDSWPVATRRPLRPRQRLLRPCSVFSSAASNLSVLLTHPDATQSIDRRAGEPESDLVAKLASFLSTGRPFVAAASIVLFVTALRCAGKAASMDAVVALVGQIFFARMGSGLRRQRDRSAGHGFCGRRSGP